jgi:3-hydroxyisobutyrate dehydrogenase-like beta-hydroxyacid dehydrogenase
MAYVAVLGLGAMGSRMAQQLLTAGHKVSVYNRTPATVAPLVAAGAIAAPSPRAAVSGVEFAISMVRDNAASQSIWLDPETGALGGLSENAVAIESSTLTVSWIQELAEHFRIKGIGFLDAPVAGSRPQAEAAQLIYFVGGDIGIMEKALPILKTLGSAVHYTGPTGSSAAVKLMVNALFGVQLAVMGELIGFVQRCGFNESKAVEILSSTPVCSPAAKAAAGAMIARNFTPMFPIDLVEKDFGYLLETAEANKANTPMTAIARHIFSEVIKQGYGDENITAVARLYMYI